jgi:predicted dehydrogenase
MRVAVVGVGHLGKEHARIYAGLPGVELAGVCDVDRPRAGEVAGRCGSSPFFDFRELPEGLDAVSIAVPTERHAEAAEWFLSRGVSALVEKPMTPSSGQAKRLAELARGRGVVLQPGYIERFHPVWAALAGRLDRPRYIESLRISPFRFRSADIGAVMDLMIHDIDQILHLVGSPLRSVHAVGVPVITRHEDVANARLEFADGCVANLTASRVSGKALRELRLFQDDAYCSIDFREGKARIFRKAGKETVEDLARRAGSSVAGLGERGMEMLARLIRTEEVSGDGSEPLRREIESFLEAVRRKSPPAVSADEAVRALEVAEEILKGIRPGR